MRSRRFKLYRDAEQRVVRGSGVRIWKAKVKARVSSLEKVPSNNLCREGLKLIRLALLWTITNQLGLVASPLAALINNAASSSSVAVALRWHHERNIVGHERVVYLVARSKQVVVVVLGRNSIQIKLKVNVGIGVNWKRSENELLKFAAGQELDQMTYATSSPAYCPVSWWDSSWWACRSFSSPRSTSSHNIYSDWLRSQHRQSLRVSKHWIRLSSEWLGESQALWYRLSMWTYDENASRVERWRKSFNIASMWRSDESPSKLMLRSIANDFYNLAGLPLKFV